MSTTTSFSTREAWSAAVKDNPLTIETFDAERPRTLIYNDTNTVGVLELETVRPTGATGSMVIIADTNSQNINGTTALYLGLDGNPKASLTIHFPKPVLAWGVDYSAPNSVGDSARATFNEDTYDFPATNAEGFIGFVSDTPISSILIQNPDSNFATLVLDDFSFITGPRITSPIDGAIVTSGDSVLFSAIPAEVIEPTWTSSIDGVLGSGTSLSSDLLSTGIHQIAITDGSSESTFLLAVLDLSQTVRVETLQNSITELTQQAECQRVFSVLKFADALQLVLDENSQEDDYIELDQSMAERLSINVDEAISCVQSITNLLVQLKGEEPEEEEEPEEAEEVDLEILLYDTGNDRLIATLEEGTEISEEEIEDRKITIRASIPEDSRFYDMVGSMEVNLNNGQIVKPKAENREPYSLFGEKESSSWGQEDILKKGVNTVTFSLFSDKDLQGTALGTVTRNFTVIDD